MQRYSFLDTIFSVNGVEITGWDEGDDVINMERRNDSATDKVGAGGEMLASISADRSGEVTIKLLQSSPSHAYLLDLLGRQEGGNFTFVPVNLRFADTFRQDLGIGSGGYIKKMPALTRGASGQSYEWVFVVERLDLLAANAGF